MPRGFQAREPSARWASPRVAATCMALALPGGTGCTVARIPVRVPDGDGPAVIVGSAALGGGLEGVARHPWIALRDDGATAWERWEVMCCPHDEVGPSLDTVHQHQMSPVEDYGGGGGRVRFHGVFRGERARRMISCVREEGPRYPYRHQYLMWPGPNSNTFVDWVLRACDIPVSLLSTSIGKDYRGVVGASVTSEGTGIQLETPVFGIRIGVHEGIQLHLFGLSVGIDFWPPAIIVPAEEGRLGIGDR